jgi:hypothetical protein
MSPLKIAYFNDLIAAVQFIKCQRPFDAKCHVFKLFPSTMMQKEMKTVAEQYARLAAHLRDKARREESPNLRAEWEHLAQCYVDLAEQAARNNAGYGILPCNT